MEKVRVNVAEPVYGAQVGKVNIKIHDVGTCTGTYCPFHNPSDHPLKDAPINIRTDKYALCERLCFHGVGHDDPDSVEWLKNRLAKLGRPNNWVGIHGCDGCC